MFSGMTTAGQISLRLCLRVSGSVAVRATAIKLQVLAIRRGCIPIVSAVMIRQEIARNVCQPAVACVPMHLYSDTVCFL